MAEKDDTPSERLSALITEKERIEKWLTPPAPDPTAWPPAGWAVHPENPKLLYKVVTAEQLQKELFGDPEREEGERIAKNRLAEINKELIPIFYPNPKEEGTQRKKAFGFAVMLKTGLKRVVDMAALYPVLEQLPKTTEGKVIDWKADLKLKEYRELSEKHRAIFDQALIITPEAPKLEIKRLD
jgi:hypothetical protein